MSSLRALWPLDPAITFLNHGSFGACPRAVLDEQSRWRERIESEPVRFFARDLEGLLDLARRDAAAFMGCDPEDFAFVTNATAGVSTVLRSLELTPGDELLTTNHAYNACRNAFDAAAARFSAKVVTAAVPFPLQSSAQVVEAVLAHVTPRTKLALLDYVTSPTGLVFPIPTLVRELDRRGVDTLVDGAHVPGMLPVRVDDIEAAYFTGNFHKWTCAPKGAAFLHVRRDRQSKVRPLAISHGANSARTDRSRFRLEFDWVGTDDPTPQLCVPVAIRYVGGLVAGGWPEVMRLNREKALAARATLCAALGIAAPAPDEMIGSLVALPISDGSAEPQKTPLYSDSLQDSLLFEHQIEVPIVPWPRPPHRLVRVSAHLHNEPSEYARLAAVLSKASS